MAGLLSAAALFWACAESGAGLREEREACEHPPVIARLISPDQAWEAVVYRRICVFGPLAGQTSIRAEVWLVSTRDPSRAEIALGVPSSHDDTGPRLAWTAPDVLQVNVRDPPFLVKVLTCSVSGIRVELRFDETPETKARQARWNALLRERGLPPELPDKAC